MVEQNAYLDGLFSSLADPIRRDILRRLLGGRYSIGQIAGEYDISFAAVAKHVGVLERARLVTKERRGKEQLVRVVPAAITDASRYLAQYEALWNQRLDALEQVIQGE